MTGVMWQFSPSAQRALTKRGLVRPRLSMAEMMKSRGIIDIDGNKNAWSSLYWKLLSSSVTLKVTSTREQWYYDALVPWKHYVSVSPGLADLDDGVRFVLDAANDVRLQRMASASTALVRDPPLFSPDHMASAACAYLQRAWNK